MNLRITTKYFCVTFLVLHKISNAVTLNKLVARIDNEYILYSDLEKYYTEMNAVKSIQGTISRKDILESLINSKILVAKAKENKISVSDNEISHQIELRMADIISKLGDCKQVENYFDKSILELKHQFREVLEEQFLQEKQKAHFIAGISITPLEVISYFSNTQKSEHPYLPVEFDCIEISYTPELPSEKRLEAIELFKKYKTYLEFKKEDLLENNHVDHEIFENYGNFIEKGEETLPVELGGKFNDFIHLILNQEVGKISEPILNNRGVMLVYVLSKDSNFVKFQYLYMKFLYLIRDMNETDQYKPLIDYKNKIFSQPKISEKIMNTEGKSMGLEIKISRKAGLDKFPQEVIHAFDEGEISKGSFYGPFVDYDDSELSDKVKLLYFIEVYPDRYADIKTDYPELLHFYMDIQKKKVLLNCINSSRDDFEIWKEDIED